MVSHWHCALVLLQCFSTFSFKQNLLQQYWFLTDSGWCVHRNVMEFHSYTTLLYPYIWKFQVSYLDICSTQHKLFPFILLSDVWFSEFYSISSLSNCLASASNTVKFLLTSQIQWWDNVEFVWYPINVFVCVTRSLFYCDFSAILRTWYYVHEQGWQTEVGAGETGDRTWTHSAGTRAWTHGVRERRTSP